MKLAITSQLHGSGNQNPDWKRKLKTSKTPAEECYYPSCMLNLLHQIRSTFNSWPSPASADQFSIKEHFLFK